MQLLPPHPSKCQCCAVAHLPDQPHNAQSLHYQYWFYGQNGRWPTWADAMAHCPEEIQQKWKADFIRLNIDINSTNLTGDIKSKADLENRLQKIKQHDDNRI